MSKSIFISTVFEDSHRIESIQKWVDQKKLGNVTITKETEDKRPLGKEEIKKHISNKINGSGVVLVLVGQDTHNHGWIEAEVELANSFHKDVICMKIPNSTGPLPPILKNQELINFDPESLKKALDNL